MGFPGRAGGAVLYFSTSGADQTPPQKAAFPKADASEKQGHLLPPWVGGTQAVLTGRRVALRGVFPLRGHLYTGTPQRATWFTN